MPPSGTRPQPPAGTVRVAISGTQATQAWTNVVYLKLTDDGTETSADLKTVVDIVNAAYATRFKPFMAATLTITDVKATWILAGGGALEYENSVSIAGTAAGALVADNCCYVINWAINQYYRGGHPRTYLPGLVVGNATGGNQITTAAQAALATAAANWITDCNAATGVHVSATALGTVSFARGNAWRTPPVFYGYKAASVRNIIGTQRRRLGGR